MVGHGGAVLPGRPTADRTQARWPLTPAAVQLFERSIRSPCCQVLGPTLQPQ